MQADRERQAGRHSGKEAGKQDGQGRQAEKGRQEGGLSCRAA
jgi:hypothetical protein